MWGLTTLPDRPDFTAGGSSGGEAALLSLDGSLCGWGTDIGGSVRGPSHFNGLFGLKPTVKSPATDKARGKQFANRVAEQSVFTPRGSWTS